MTSLRTPSVQESGGLAVRGQALLGGWFLAAAFSLAGCAETVTFSVQVPPKVDLAKVAAPGKTPAVSFGVWNADPARVPLVANIPEDLRSRTEKALLKLAGNSFQVVPEGGDLVLEATVETHEEQVSESLKSEMCNRYINGQMRREACSLYLLKGSARFTARLRIKDARGTLLHTQPFGWQDAIEERNDKHTSFDWGPALARAKDQAALVFASTLVLTTVSVERKWFKCGAQEPSCREGLRQLHAGQFADAYVTLEKAAGELPADGKARAAAWWGAALAKEFARDWDGARYALKKAAEADDRDEFAQELVLIDLLASQP
jgi:hypothetical protein